MSPGAIICQLMRALHGLGDELLIEQDPKCQTMRMFTYGSAVLWLCEPPWSAHKDT
jgi:hypothetical protein